MNRFISLTRITLCAASLQVLQVGVAVVCAQGIVTGDNASLQTSQGSVPQSLLRHRLMVDPRASSQHRDAFLVAFQ